MLSACQGKPRTDEELTSRAQEAVDRNLGVQAQFSLMEATVAQQIACGHAAAPGKSEQDFVYRDGRVILDNDIDFDAAAAKCDEAVAGDNIQSDDDNAVAS